MTTASTVNPPFSRLRRHRHRSIHRRRPTTMVLPTRKPLSSPSTAPTTSPSFPSLLKTKAPSQKTASRALWHALLIGHDQNSDAYWSIGLLGTYGSISVDENGSWTYTLNNGIDGESSVVQDLNEGQLSPIHSPSSSDDNGVSDTQTVVVSINGSNDEPVLSFSTERSRFRHRRQHPSTQERLFLRH